MVGVSTNNSVGQSRLALSISVGLVLSLMLGFGAFTQLIFVNGVMGEADGFYEAYTPDGFLRPQSFVEWINSFYSLWHLPLSIVACFISFRKSGARQIFLPLAFNIFLVLMVVDTGYAIAIPENRGHLLESYLSNALGSPVIALVLCLILLVVTRAQGVIPIRPPVACIFGPFILGSLLFFVLFVLVKNLFWVTTSDISALMVMPIKGTYSAHKIDGDVNDKFGLFLNTQIPPEKLSWKGNALDFGLGIADLDKRAMLDAYLFDGCPATKTGDALTMLRNPVFSAHGVSIVGLGIDDGFADFSIHPISGSSGHWKSTEEEVSMFWIDAGSEKSALNLTSFISSKVGVKHLEWSGDVIYRIDAFAIGDRELKARTFSLRADDVEKSLTVHPSPDMDLQRTMACKPVAFDRGSYKPASPLVTMFLRVSYPARRVVADVRPPHETFIRGLNGWLYTDDVGADEIGKYVNEGALSFISMQGRLEELFIDHEPVETRRTSWLFMQDGELSGAVEGEMLRMEGKTNVAALDGGRLTKTRWERIGFAVKSLIVSVPAAIVFLLGVFLKAWRENESLIGIKRE